MKDGRTRLGYKPEHAVDLDTGAIVAAPIHGADQGDTSSLPGTLEAAEENLGSVGMEPSPEDPAELVADKGYHSRGGLKDLEDGAWKSRISEPKSNGIHRWHGDDDAKRAYYNNRARLLSEVARQAFKLRAELVERSFAHILDRGGMRRAWLRGRDNLQKRYLVHVSGYNLGLIMRLLTGSGTPRRWAEANIAIIWFSFHHQSPNCRRIRLSRRHRWGISRRDTRNRARDVQHLKAHFGNALSRLSSLSVFSLQARLQ